MTRCQRSSRSGRSATVRAEMPAELTSTSIPPNAARAASAIASVSARDVTSPAATTNAAPAFPSSAAISAHAASLRSLATTLAPSAANRRAQAAPIPDTAPVVTATLSCNLFEMEVRSPRR